MKMSEKLLFLMRIALGWLFFYAGFMKIITPGWSAAGYLGTAKTFAGFYAFLASPSVLPVINFIVAWGLLLLGLSLILGLFLRLSTVLGAVLMFLFYLPVLTFPYIGKNYFLVDDHIIFLLALLILGNAHAGRFWGLETWCSKLPICSRYPKLRQWLG